MNVAVAANSPLAQYLAELDEDSSATSLAAVLAVQQPNMVASAASNDQRTGRPTSLHNSAASRSSNKRRPLLLTSAQIFATDQLLAKLSTCSQFADLRDDVVEAAMLGDATPATTRWWIPHAFGQLHSGAAFIGAAIAVALATSAALPGDSFEASAYMSLWKIVRIVLIIVVLVMIGVEVFYQLLLARYTFATQRLVEASRLFLTAHEDLQTAFRLGLDIVKRSELVARGYRLGRILPPIGRLEEASRARDPTFELQCRRLRTQLREINDSIERAGRAVASRTSVSAPQEDNATTEQLSESEDRATPSLLTTALAKRHELSLILVENALRAMLVVDLAPLLDGRSGRDGQSFLSTTIDHTQTYRSLTMMMKALTLDLSRWTTRLHCDIIVDDETEIISAVQEKNVMPNDVAAVSRALMQVHASCETLRILALTSQHDIEEAFSFEGRQANEVVETRQTHASETKDNETTLRWQTRLRQSRDQMEKFMKQLTSDWEHLERVMQVACESGSASVSCEDDSATMTDETVVAGPATSGDERRQAAELERLAQQAAERDYLLVFTATSTGEKDFDLQSLLRLQQQQQQQRSSADTTPVPSFMSELQDVLGRRQTLSTAPTLEKRIGDDGPLTEPQTLPLASRDVALPILQPPSPPRTVDLQQLLQSRFTAQLTEEYFGGRESDEDEEEEVAADAEERET